MISLRSPSRFIQGITKTACPGWNSSDPVELKIQERTTARDEVCAMLVRYDLPCFKCTEEDSLIYCTEPKTKSRKIQNRYQQDPNAGNSRVAECRSQKVPKHDYGHFRTSEQHGSTNQLAEYDFLLVYFGYIRSRWSRHRVVSRQS